MARIRSIKPEFPQSETVGNLTRDARLLFIQLWTIVDDSGRARAASRMLASLLYPYDDDAPRLIGKWLDELEAKGCIRRYEVDGSSFLDIPNWLKHQKIDRPTDSRLPEYREPSSNPREDSRALDADLGPSILDLGEDQVSRASARETDDWPKDFEERFWEVVPLKVGKDAAMRALGRIRRKRRCTFAKLITSMQRYAVSVVGKERRFIKHPATWLNHGCYDDEPEVMAPVVRLVTDTSKVRIPSEDPRWIPLADRYKREKGLWPPMGRDMAWDFPVDWVSDLSPLEAEAS